MPGTLFVVATPIGNLEDLTFRALRTLRECDLIAAEDTRRTAKLLAHYEIRKPMISVRAHNEARQTDALISRLSRGEAIALVTDAGTPGISDPGGRVVTGVRDAGLPVVAIPGPSAVTAAISVAGLGETGFAFLGFAPAGRQALQTWIAGIRNEPRPVIFYEAPHRVRQSVGNLLAEGISPIFVFRELTKIHESLVICSSVGDVERIPRLGEFTLVIPGQSESHNTLEDDKRVMAIIQLYSMISGPSALERRDAVGVLSLVSGLDEVRIKKIVKSHKFSGK